MFQNDNGLIYIDFDTKIISDIHPYNTSNKFNFYIIYRESKVILSSTAYHIKVLPIETTYLNKNGTLNHFHFFKQAPKNVDFTQKLLFFIFFIVNSYIFYPVTF